NNSGHPTEERGSVLWPPLGIVTDACPGGRPFSINGRSSGSLTKTFPSGPSRYAFPRGSAGIPARIPALTMSPKLAGRLTTVETLLATSCRELRRGKLRLYGQVSIPLTEDSNSLLNVGHILVHSQCSH